MKPVLIITRPAATALSFAEGVKAVAQTGYDVIYSPALEIIDLLPESPDWADTGLILTSSNGVRAAQRLGAPLGTRAYCVGRATTEAAKGAGFEAIFSGETADVLVQSLLCKTNLPRLIHISGKHRRGHIVERLTQAGLNAEVVEAYDQVRLNLSKDALDALLGKQPVVLPVFSPRSAGLIRGVTVVAPLYLVLISEAVHSELAHLTDARVLTAMRPNATSMINATAEALETASNASR